MNKYPSIAEFSGLYNIEPEDYRQSFLSPDEDENRYYKTVDSAPHLNWDEFKSVTEAVYTSLEKHARLPWFTDEDAKNYFSYCVGDGISDRTVQFLLPDVRLLTPLVVRSLQSEVLSTRPLWRIATGMDRDDTTIYIYPQTVRVAGASIDANWEDELAFVVKKDWQYREPIDGPRRRQFVYSKERLPSLISSFDSMPFQIIGIFDNFMGDFSKHALRMVFAGATSKDMDIEYSEGFGTCESFPVRSDGYFGKLYQNDKANIWTRCWVFPCETIEITALRYEEYKPIPGQIYRISIKSESIIQDNDLKLSQAKDNEIAYNIFF